MSKPPLHPWKLDPEEAIQLQAQLRERLVLSWDGRPVTTVGGVDVSYTGDLACAGIVILSYPDLAPLESVTAFTPLIFPYIPGLLTFREGPPILAAWEKLAVKPALLLFDGQGIAHPRGLGLASHLGLWLEIPTMAAGSWC